LTAVALPCVALSAVALSSIALSSIGLSYKEKTLNSQPKYFVGFADRSLRY
jgi:hypothetical protein